MLHKELSWFFSLFQQEFRQGKLLAFEMVMFLALAHFFGFYHPKQLADFLGIPPPQLSTNLKAWSLYSLKEMLLRFMVKQAVAHLKPVLAKSNATTSSAGITWSVDNRVMDRLGKLLRCTWSGYSGRSKKVVNGNELWGIVLTINGVVIPVHGLFCSKQGRAHPAKPSLLLAMLQRLIDAVAKEGIAIRALPLTMDSGLASETLKQQLYQLGFKKVIIAGKGNYPFTIKEQKQKAALWKKAVVLVAGQWGIAVPSCRVTATSPTFGNMVLFFYEKSTTRTYY